MPKPKDVLRILVLGDSVAFGPGVPENETFSNLLESRLKEQGHRVDVINTGVPGYTTYSELQYYLTAGRHLEPDIVLLAFCMNDIVNPRLHWGYTSEKISVIPDKAIPNLEYDREYVQPKMKRLRKAQKTEAATKRSFAYRNSALYRFVYSRTKSLFEKEEKAPAETADKKKKTKPKSPPLRVAIPSGTRGFLTGEDSIKIDVLLDDTSPEMAWLRKMLDELNDAVMEDGATLIIAIFPMAYQVDPDYPLSPQRNLLKYCRQHAVPCIDMVQSFKGYSKEDLFMLKESNYTDWWHLGKKGHRISAEILLKFLEKEYEFIL
jgi:lysophospholipase L1-like esterase